MSDFLVEGTSIQPITEDYSTDGMLDEFARIDHQHPLSPTLRAAIYNSTLYVKKSGDTITGTLIHNVGGVEAERFITDGSYLSFYNATQTLWRGYLQGNAAGMLLNSLSGTLSLNGVGGITMTPFTINGYTASEATAVNRIVLAGAGGYIIGNYINMTADIGGGYPAYIAGQNGDNYLRWYNKSGAFSATQVVSAQNMGAGGWGAATFLANPGAGNAAIALHCGGVAPILYTANGFGNNFYHRDSVGNTGSANCVALAYLGDSSLRWKKNINDWPLKSAGAAVESATDLINKMRIVTWQTTARDVEIPSGRRLKAYHKLNGMRMAKGLGTYELPIHDCAEHDCIGTVDRPCIRVRDTNRERIGLIAEEVNEIVPSVVHLDPDEIPAALDIGQLAILAIAAVKELSERVGILEGVH